ncbi:MAG: hypothetical protein R3C03_10025 [Pirellulaceae bacterium]
MKRTRSQNTHSYQSLEDRRCMAVVVGASDGNMYVEGNANGIVEVYAVGEQAFAVRDNGIQIGGVIENVTGNLKISLDQSGGAQNDHVRIEMLDEAFQNIRVDLGDGNNHVELTGTHRTGFEPSHYVQRVQVFGGAGDDTIDVDLITNTSVYASTGGGNDTLTQYANSGLVQFVSGNGDDTLNVLQDKDPKIGRVVGRMGAGDDSVFFNAKAYGDLAIWAGSGNDDVEIGPDAVLLNSFAHLGDGDNTLGLSGWVAGHLRVRAAQGNDTINLRENSFAANAGILLGNGVNTYNLAGVTKNDFFVRGGSGTDDVNLESTYRGVNFRAVLGDGDNELHNIGEISGDLVGISRNSLDTLLNDGIVDGRIYLKPGGQA